MVLFGCIGPLTNGPFPAIPLDREMSATPMRGRKPEIARLQDLVPETVAARVCEHLVGRASGLADVLQLGVPPEWRGVAPDELAKTTQVGRDMSELVRWAQIGHVDAEAAYDLFLALYPHVYARPTGSDDVPPLDEIDPQPTDEIGFVFLAAIARFNLRTGAEVEVRGLAALAGLSYERVRHMAAQGKLLRSRRGRVSADEARRFLEQRGLPF
jgi:hypothetical protein